MGLARDKVLRAALELVGESGVAGLTNRNVARRAGVALGSLTYHFESQTQLLHEALALFLAEETARLQRLADALRDAELTDEQGVEALQTLLEQQPERRIAKLELYLHATRDPSLVDAAMECFAAYDQLAASALRSLGVADADRLAPVMVAVIDGLQLRRLASGEARLELAEPLRALLRGVRADPG